MRSPIFDMVSQAWRIGIKRKPWQMPPRLRFLSLIGIYGFILLFSSQAALQLRFDFAVPEEFNQRWYFSSLWIIPLKLLLLAFFGQFRSLLTFFSFPDAKRLSLALGLAMVIELGVWFLAPGESMIPRGVIVVEFVLSLACLAGLRIGMRMFREQILSQKIGASGHAKKRVAIIGAGGTGASLLGEIELKPGLGMDVICFLDDDTHKIGRTLHGRQIFGPRKRFRETLEMLSIDKCILAIPDAPPAVIKEMVALLNDAGVEHDIVPSIDRILQRDVTVNHLRHVSPEDLLGRPPVFLDQNAVSKLITNQTVLVTGAGGSIGSELCRQLAALSPKKLILVERSESALFLIEQDILSEFLIVPIEPIAANVCDEECMQAIFEEHRPDYVFHAAAHKHVPLMERQPAEAIFNNVIGTLVTARLASKYASRGFVLVSTDKAVNPTSIMGASKCLAEIVVNSIHNLPDNRTAFSSVRFGNVLDSSGSVIRIFRRQIAAGGPVTITHPDITRYFMSIPEAVGLILQSTTFSSGGEIFVLDMGEPVKIRDLACQMIELSGLVPERDIAIEIIGLRPGEKLHEETVHDLEKVFPTPNPKIRCLKSPQRADNVIHALDEIRNQLYSFSDSRLKRWIFELVPDYKNLDQLG